MFQRIQTLYLFGALAASVLLFIFPLANFIASGVFSSSDAQVYKFFITGVVSMIPGSMPPVGKMFGWPLLLLNVVSGLLTLYSLTLFRKRLLQMRLVAVNIILNILLIGLIYLYYINQLQVITGITPAYRLGVFMPLGTLMLLVLAYYAIRKDEALVKSTDRLR
jgi:hypothetical protein